MLASLLRLQVSYSERNMQNEKSSTNCFRLDVNPELEQEGNKSTHLPLTRTSKLAPAVRQHTSASATIQSVLNEKQKFSGFNEPE